MLRESQFDRACELFYEAAADADLWPGALQALAEASGSWGVNLMPVGSGAPSTITSPNTQEMIDDFIARDWVATNPRMKRGLQLTRAGWKGLITERDMFGSELPKDAWHTEFLPRYGMGSFAGLVLAEAGPDLAVPLSIERRVSDGHFTRSELAKLNRLVARLRPAAVLALKVGFATARKIADGFGRIGRDMALLGGSGRLLHHGSALERHIGDALNVRNGVLSSWETNANQLLASAIGKAASAAPATDRVVRPVLLPRRSGGRPLLAELVPIAGAAHDVFMLARVALLISDPEETRVGTAETIAAMFGLSAAEARLARRIAVGEELKDIADAEHVTLETARTRLKAVFAKTGTHRQTELALLIATLSR